MLLYTCRNCENEKGLPGKHFEADAPVCPHCGCDQKAKDPKEAALVVDRLVIHLDPPHPKLKGKGQGVTACDGTKLGLPLKNDQRVMGTGVRELVNCDKCKDTEAFKSDVQIGSVLKALDQG